MRKIFILISCFSFSISILAGSKKSVIQKSVEKVKTKVTTKINNTDLKKSLDKLTGKVNGVVGDISNVKNDLTGIRGNIEGIVAKNNENKTKLDETQKKLEANDGRFNKVQAQFEKFETSIKSLVKGETSPKEMLEASNIGQVLKDIKELSEAILILRNDLGMIKQLVLSNYQLLFYVTRDTCRDIITDDNAGLGCSYTLKNDDQMRRYFKNIKLDIQFITNEDGEVLISGLSLNFKHPDSTYNVKLDKIGMSPKITLGGQKQNIDLVFSSTVEETDTGDIAVKTFTAELDEPIVLAGDRYTGLSSIRDSDLNQDLSFELGM